MKVVFSAAPAIVHADSGQVLSYPQLIDTATRNGLVLTEQGHDLVFLLASSTIESVIDYVSLRLASVPVVLLDPAVVDHNLLALIDRYEPSGVIGARQPIVGYEPSGLPRLQSRSQHSPELAGGPERPAVLLPTSGSTGNPKLVQLSGSNLDANALDIAVSLGIEGDDRGLNPLPLFYSYGLSIVNSHLAVGATTILTEASPIRPEFWEIIASEKPTSIPGVPYSYELFRRSGLLDRDLGQVRYLSQAGGKLNPEAVLQFHSGLQEQGRKLFVMYGQTEAAPRMSVLPSEDLPAHLGSVGFPLGSGKFQIENPDSAGVGEVLYEGPNVMIGYAESRSDLGHQSQTGPLHTGDLGRLDDDGRLYVTGRIKRFAKLFGTRINLDDIESRFVGVGLIAAVDGDNKIRIFTEQDPGIVAAAGKDLERALRLPPRSIQVEQVDCLPLNKNGKVDYRSLTQ